MNAWIKRCKKTEMQEEMKREFNNLVHLLSFRYLIKLQFLQELNLSENLIKRFPNCLHLMEKLHVLKLHSNLIEKLPKQTSGE